MYELDGKVAIVTGAGRRGGIGAAIAMRLAREGANVVVGDICAPFSDQPNPGGGSWEELEAIAREVEALGVRSLPVCVDVTDATLVEDMVAQTMEAFGRLDVLVNNAGAVVGPAPVVQMAEQAWCRTMEINATGTFLCCKAALPPMIQGGRGGRIINVSSAAAKAPRPYLAGRWKGRHSLRGWANRSATTQSTAGSCPIPRWLLRTATFSLLGPVSWRQARQSTTPSQRE